MEGLGEKFKSLFCRWWYRKPYDTFIFEDPIVKEAGEAQKTKKRKKNKTL